MADERTWYFPAAEKPVMVRAKKSGTPLEVIGYDLPRHKKLAGLLVKLPGKSGLFPLDRFVDQDVDDLCKRFGLERYKE